MHALLLSLVLGLALSLYLGAHCSAHRFEPTRAPTPTPMTTPAQVELDSQRDKWLRSGIVGYTFNYSVDCDECFDGTGGRAIEVAVESGLILWANPCDHFSSVHDRSNEENIVAVYVCSGYRTLETLFDLIYEASRGELDTSARLFTNERWSSGANFTVEDLMVRYNREYGYPEYIEISYTGETDDYEVQEGQEGYVLVGHYLTRGTTSYVVDAFSIDKQPDIRSPHSSYDPTKAREEVMKRLIEWYTGR